MRLNNRGELSTLAIIGIVAGYSVVIAILPVLNPVTMIQRIAGQPVAGSRTAEGQKATWTKQIEREKPVFYTIPATATQPGTVVTATESERIYDTGTEEKAQILTYGQRVAKFFADLSTWGLVAVIGVMLFLYFVVGWTPWMLMRRVKNRAEQNAERERIEKEKYQKALTQTVAGIRDIKDPVVYEAVTSKLGIAQDKDVKATIDVVKAGLHS